jgi:PAS domain S-box-containing protein
MALPAADRDVQLAFDLAPVGLVISRNRVIQSCNVALSKMFGYEQGELEGRSLQLLYPTPVEFETIGARGLPIMLETGFYSDERIMKRKDEFLFWCHVSGHAADRLRPFDCAVWAFEDISDKRPASALLSDRERDVARLLVTGMTSKEIARQIGISPRTVEAHRARLLRKFGLRTPGQLIARLAGIPN